MFNRSYLIVFSAFFVIFTGAQNFCSARSSDLLKAELKRAKILKEQMDELHEKGRYREAIAVGEEVLSVRVKVLGSEHPAVATVLNCLGSLYESQGIYEEAEPLFIRALAIDEKALGSGHTYYYAIASNLPLSAKELYRFCHKRQCTEAGFRELKNHYNLERLPFKTLKANEFWLVCKIVAMTLFKIFQTETLPKSLQYLLRKTLLRRIFRKGLCSDKSGKVRTVPKSKYKWHLRRLLCRIERMKPTSNY